MSVVLAFLRRDWLTSRSYRLHFALELLSSASALVLFFFLARLVDASRLPAEAGAAEKGYFAYAFVGIALMGVMHTGLESFATKIRGEQARGTLESMLATPAPPELVLVAGSVFEFARATVSALAAGGVAIAFFGFRPETDFPSLVVAATGFLGCVVLFAAVGIGIAAFTMVFKQTGALLGLALGAVALTSGAYFPVELLPGPLATAAALSPFTWGMDVVRAAVLGGTPEVGRLGLLYAADVLLLALAIRVFRAATRHARLRGTLSHT